MSLIQRRPYIERFHCILILIMVCTTIIGCMLSQEYEVDLALWAHHHLYHRSCPVYQEVCVEDGPVHIVMGMGGQGLSDNVE